MPDLVDRLTVAEKRRFVAMCSKTCTIETLNRIAVILERESSAATLKPLRNLEP